MKVEPALNASAASTGLSLTVNTTACSFEGDWRVPSRTRPAWLPSRKSTITASNLDRFSRSRAEETSAHCSTDNANRCIDSLSCLIAIGSSHTSRTLPMNAEGAGRSMSFMPDRPLGCNIADGDLKPWIWPAQLLTLRPGSGGAQLGTLLKDPIANERPHGNGTHVGF